MAALEVDQKHFCSFQELAELQKMAHEATERLAKAGCSFSWPVGSDKRSCRAVTTSSRRRGWRSTRRSRPFKRRRAMKNFEKQRNMMRNDEKQLKNA